MTRAVAGSSVLATKTAKKSMDPLPDLETYRASRSKMKSSVKVQSLLRAAGRRRH